MKNITGQFRPQVNICTQFTALSLILGIVSLACLHPVSAQERSQPRTLTVIGQGVVTIPTTRTEVSLGVEVRGKTAAEVQQEVARRSSAVVELLRSRNVEKLETTSINLEPTYNSENGKRRFTGFEGNNIVKFQIDTLSSGNLLDAAVNAGATRINGIRFVATDEAIVAARKQAVREATQDAQMQADAALEALNLTRKDIVSIQINRFSLPSPSFFSDGFAPPRFGVNSNPLITPVLGGEQQVQAFVSLYITY